MSRRSYPSWCFHALLLAVAAAPACVSEYDAVTLDDFDRPAIDGEAVALTRPGTFGHDVWLYDGAVLHPLTNDSAPRDSYTLQISPRFIGWAQYLQSGVDIFAYDRSTSQVVNVSHTPQSEDPFFGLADDHFAWKDRAPDFSEYDVVVSDGHTNTVINEASNDAYSAVSQDLSTSAGNVAYSAHGTDPEDGSTDNEVFFYDGGAHALVQVTDDPGTPDKPNGRDDGSALISADRVTFLSTRDGEPYQLRLYDARLGQTTVVAEGGTAIASGQVLDDTFGAYPMQFSGDLLLWNGALVDLGPHLLVTDVATGETHLLDDLVGGSVAITAATADGYVATFVSKPDLSTDVVIYQASTGTVTTVASYPPGGLVTSGIIAMSGPNLAYNHYDPVHDLSQVTIHYLRPQPAGAG